MTRYSDPKDLQNELNERQANSRERLHQYQQNRSAYFGDQENEAGAHIKGMDSSGRALLQWGRLREELVNRGGAPNLLTPIVDDFTALRGTVPTMKVLPQDESEDSKKQAVDWSRLVRSQWSNSSMDIQQMEAAWFTSCLGDFAYTLTPLFPDDVDKDDGLRPPGIYITVVDPQKCYPRFRTGWDRHELDDLIIFEEIDPEIAYSEWDVEPIRGEKVVKTYHYLSRDWNCLVVGDEIVSEVQHDLGFCPAEFHRNKVVGQGKFAQSDIAQVIDQHREMQVMYLVMADSLIETTYSQLVVKDPTNVSEQFEVGPGAQPIVVQGTGGVERIQPANPPTAAQMILDKTWSNIQHMTGSAPVRTEQQIGGSNISARAVNAVQGPMETRLGAAQTLLGARIQRLNSKMLLMFYRLKEFHKDMTIWGQDQGTPFQMTFNGKDLGGWHRNTVEYGAMIGSTNHEKAVVGLQLKGQNLVPGEWVLEQIGVDDPQMLIKQAQDEKLEQAQLDMKIQQMAQGPPPGGPGGPPQDPGQQQAQIMGPANQAQSLAGGQMPQNAQGSDQGGAAAGGPQGAGGGPPQPPPQQDTMPQFPPLDTAPNQPGIGTPTPLPDASGEIQQAIAELQPQLQGQILGARPVPGGLEILITDFKDKVTIRKALRGFGKLEIKVVTQKKAA